ncbi:D-alanyl-D-alanine carboxypeptidase/D-alanyl-D-alanine-endopeptidase [Thermodesulfobacteriota bacterium]
MCAEVKAKIIFNFTIWITVFFFGFLQSGRPDNLYAATFSNLKHLIGKRDALLVASPQGKILFEKNAAKKMIPASTLKIFTSLVGLHYLGPDYRFPTEFYLDQGHNLKIKGYGDPFLISEALMDMAATLVTRLSRFNDLVIDDSYFEHPVRIPGTTPSYQPYDAPNGALCVNFNTVNFKRINNTYVSAEAQTPLLPFVLERIKSSSLDHGRIVLSYQQNESALYAGHLFRHFLNQNGINSTGTVRIGHVRKPIERLILKYISPFSLKQGISRLLEFSNNFIANQILIAAGAKVYGPPGTLDKGVRSALIYAGRVLKTKGLSFVEGSGISRKNRLSAKFMLKVLNEFESYHYLMRQQGSEFYKTGNLNGITTRAGYLESNKGELYRFILLLNTPGKSADTIMQRIRLMVEPLDG